MKLSASLEKLSRQVNLELESLVQQKQIALGIVEEINQKIADFHAALQTIIPHDCTQAGTRKVYQFPNARQAILAFLPKSRELAMTPGQLHAKMKAANLTYALATIKQTLGTNWDELHDNGADVVVIGSQNQFGHQSCYAYFKK